MRLIALLLLIAVSMPPAAEAEEAEIVLVSFTAEWCPNCKILDPKMHEAVARFSQTEVRHVILDMTDHDTKKAAFAQVDGTLLAGVYGDHLGTTAIGILTAPDSGEKIGCITRDDTVAEIVSMISQARTIVRSEPPLQRKTTVGMCPIANEKMSL